MAGRNEDSAVTSFVLQPLYTPGEWPPAIQWEKKNWEGPSFGLDTVRKPTFTLPTTIERRFSDHLTTRMMSVLTELSGLRLILYLSNINNKQP